MMNPENPGFDDEFDELLRQVDELVSEEPKPRPDALPPEAEDFDEEDFDAGDFTPRGCQEEPILYQNFSNGYGADIRNFSNGYGGTGPLPQTQPEPSQPVIPAYNADFQRVTREEQSYIEELEERKNPRPTMSQKAVQRQTRREAPRQAPAPKPQKVKKVRRRGPGCCGVIAIALVLAVVLGFVGLGRFVFRMPKASDAVQDRKRDTATILICGTDADGTRTDTMMLLYLSGSEHRVGLLSLPRDTYTLTARGSAAKLNSAYGRNGTGEEGMEGLLDYVQEILGYRPDGYVLLSFDLVTQLVDLMGGLEIDLPNEIDTGNIVLPQGVQTLSGYETLELLRHRHSYAMQDLGRVEMQRMVVKAAMEQWLSLSSLKKLPSALSLVENHSLMSLSLPNLLWTGKTLLTGIKNMDTATLPGRADYVDGQSFYLLDRQAVAELLNESFNPSKTPISAENLQIAG